MRRHLIASFALFVTACSSKHASTPTDASTDLLADAGSDRDLALDASTDAGVDGSAISDAGIADATVCTADDPLDDNGLDSNCDGAEGVVVDSIYISLDTGNDIYGGSPQYPVKTFTRALQLLAQTPTRRTVFLATSTTPYPPDGLGTLLTKGVSVVGDLSPTANWSRPQGTATPLAATTIASNGQGVVAQVDNLTTTLSYVGLTSTRATGDGPHVTGLVITGVGVLNLSHVDITVGDAVDGANGTDGAAAFPYPPNFFIGQNSGGTIFSSGAPGANPNITCADGQVTFAGGSGGSAGATATASGKDGNPGGGGATGGTGGIYKTPNSTPPTNGTNGSAGANGLDANAAGVNDWGISGTSIASTATITAAAAGVRGGGGGGGGGSSLNSGVLFCPGGAGGGAGGCGGSPGTIGQPGGFSVGILAEGPFPLLSDVHVTTGAGGNGGSGGSGGAGESGGAGGTGGTMSSCTKGGDGGAGGAGGTGGRGSGGAGGWTIGIVAKTALGPTSGLVTTLGKPGTGGSSSGHAGANGMAVAAVSKP